MARGGAAGKAKGPRHGHRGCSQQPSCARCNLQRRSGSIPMCPQESTGLVCPRGLPWPLAHGHTQPRDVGLQSEQHALAPRQAWPAWGTAGGAEPLAPHVTPRSLSPQHCAAGGAEPSPAPLWFNYPQPFRDRGRACGHTKYDFAEFLAEDFHVWALGVERQRPPCTGSPSQGGGTALSSGVRRGRLEQQGWGHVPATTRGAGLSHAKTCLPPRGAALLRQSSRGCEMPGLSCSQRRLPGRECSCSSSLQIRKQGRLLCYK